MDLVDNAPLCAFARICDGHGRIWNSVGEADGPEQREAELLRLPVSTIYDLARTGRLPHLKIGRALRFSRSDLEAHLAERCRAHIAARA